MAAIVVKGYRPSKKADTPPPLYLTSQDIPPSYCHTCGRVVSSKRIKASAKFCSDKCKHHKPFASPDSVDRLIGDVLHQLLDQKQVSEILQFVAASHATKGSDSATAAQIEVPDTRIESSKKGEKRIIVPCSLVESIVFGREANVSRGQGRRRERARAIARGADGDGPELRGDDEYDESALLATLGKLSAGGSIPAKKQSKTDDETEESDDDTASDLSDEDDGHGVPLNHDGASTKVIATQEELDSKQRAGQKRAQQREQVRNGCRRAVVFGLLRPGMTEEQAAAEADQGETDEAEADLKGRKKSARSKGKAGGGGHKKQASQQGNGQTTPGGRKLCEAIMRGDLVEPSYAKGEWGVRWRE